MVAHCLARVLELADAALCEVIVVDGSPTADTVGLLADLPVRTLQSDPGRARQMNAGAAAARGRVLLFLHADTCLPDDALRLVSKQLAQPKVVAGAFALAIAESQPVYRCIAAAATLRSRLTRMPYGDQAIFIRAETFHALGGYRDIPIMEDIDLMRRLKQQRLRIAIVDVPVQTSGRRWRQEGVVYTTLRNMVLVLLYLAGVDPRRLVRLYPREHVS